MLKTENVMINDITLTRTYSDAGFYIYRDGAIYSEALDNPLLDREYMETNIPIEEE